MIQNVDNVQVSAKALEALVDDMLDNREAMRKIASDIIQLVVRKNHDYGDAWQRYGIFTPLIRINDKILRVKTLAGGEQAMVADEGIMDTMKDIWAYALLCILRLTWEGYVRSLTSGQTPSQQLPFMMDDDQPVVLARLEAVFKDETQRD